MKKKLSNKKEMTAQMIEKNAELIAKRVHAEQLNKRYIESGDRHKVARYVSMAYLLQSVANEYNESAISLMELYDQVHKKIKTTTNNLRRSFDAYDKVIFSLVHDDEAKHELLKDYDVMKETCDRFMNAEVRLGAYESWQDDSFRKPGLYICRVSGISYTSRLLLRWDGNSWMMWSPMTIEPYETWIKVSCKVEEVVERVIYQN